ncbi:tyrosine-protein kinase receptor TYRO3-like isoform X2 [Thalassophryne amazonica]|uniref:tyrosine-protein kinase receptor TYRO3-like isoform X2 n=1 Tax=Thalassophryne amazonica TaxID=390379 RepID=UPI001470FA3E|nr:tyrosine-protein kinase receptor TYRO3-like isoform X2 [Thalassophryne amazonica]
MMKTSFVLSGAAVLLLCGATVCAVSILIHPDLQQFHPGRSITLSCPADGHSADEGSVVWRTVGNQTQRCGPHPEDFWVLDGSSCRSSGLFPTDSGVYWCQTRDGQKSDVVPIFVSAVLILEIPALPVLAGSDVTLHCLGPDGSRVSADYYKSNTKTGSGSGSGFKITGVQKSDEGFYSCLVGQTESKRSELRVKAPLPVLSGVPLVIVVPVVSLVLLVLMLLFGELLLLWTKQTGQN